jgi:hypothetical protein
MTYKDLTPEQKKRYKEFCDEEYGKTIMFNGETGEPLYLDKDFYLIDTSIVINLLFSNSVFLS